jgi:hypothetical protein
VERTRERERELYLHKSRGESCEIMKMVIEVKKEQEDPQKLPTKTVLTRGK